MPIWPGDPDVNLRQISKIADGENANVSQIQMSVHTGTHIDAPRHFIDSGATVHEIPLEKLIGETLVMHIPDHVAIITEDVLKLHPQSDLLSQSNKVLFRTRNSSLWHIHPHTFQTNYVGLDTSGAEYLSKLGLDLIGIDYLSIAPYKLTTEPHMILLQNEIVLLEGIDLSTIPEGIFTLFCLPLFIFGCDGAPARAVLIS
jgi:arylformamidase